jgi:hypothetical protein
MQGITVVFGTVAAGILLARVATYVFYEPHGKARHPYQKTPVEPPRRPDVVARAVEEKLRP